MEDELDDDVVIQLNIDHPLNKWVFEQTRDINDTQFKAFMFRLARRMAIEGCLHRIGNLSAFRRKQVVRSLVSVFRSGYHTGHSDGYSLGKEDAAQEAEA
jgi:hypothetical protein